MQNISEQLKQNGAKYLLIGSTEAYSGKSSTLLGISQQLQAKGIDLAYAKPIGRCEHNCQLAPIDEDVKFLSQILQLPENRLGESVLFLNEQIFKDRLQSENAAVNYPERLQTSLNDLDGDLIVLEGPANLDEGYLYHLSLPEIAQLVDASVLLVVRFHSAEIVETLVAAKHRLGDRLLGVVINHILPKDLEEVKTLVTPFLEKENIPVLGLLPRINFLSGVSVAELAERLNAQVLCRNDRLNLMVETLKIGAMSVNSALKYLSNGTNMAVVTGGGRTDIQLAALETSTHCLIVTGNLRPSDIILKRAEEAEVPVLSVELDTLTTVEIISETLGKVRLHEPIKAEYIRQLFDRHFALDRFLNSLVDGVAT